MDLRLRPEVKVTVETSAGRIVAPGVGKKRSESLCAFLVNPKVGKSLARTSELLGKVLPKGKSSDVLVQRVLR